MHQNNSNYGSISKNRNNLVEGLQRQSIDRSSAMNGHDCSKKRAEPEDRFKFVYFVFYFIGVTILFPYSMLLSVTDFWNFKFRNLTLNSTLDGELTEMQKSFPAYVAISGNLPLTVFVIITAVFGYKINIKFRLVFPSLAMIVFFGGLTVLSGLQTDDWQETFYLTIIILNTFYSSSNAIFQASFLGNLGRFPPRYIGSSNDGVGLGGTLPAAINIVILAMQPDQESVGVACLAVSLVILIIMIFFYVLAARTDFYNHHAGIYSAPEKEIGWRVYLSVLRRCWPYVFLTFLNFCVTLTAYPAVAALVKPVSSEQTEWTSKYFLPVCCFLLETGVDWLGRSCATFTQWPKLGKRTEIGLMLVSFLRIAFIPLFMFCNVAPDMRKTEVLFESDLAYILIMVAFSFSGGYLTNCVLMLGPKMVSLEEQEIAGTILVTALVFGLGLGSLLGLPLVELL